MVRYAGPLGEGLPMNYAYSNFPLTLTLVKSMVFFQQLAMRSPLYFRVLASLSSSPSLFS